MQIYQPTQKGPLKINGYMDPDDVTIIKIIWGATTWNANTVYRSNDIVKPTTDNGYYYTVSMNGRSGLTEPNWLQEDTTDNDVLFSANPWDLWLLPDQILTASSWSATSGVTLDNLSMSDVYSSAMITDVDSTLTEFEITNQVTKDNGEKLSRTLLYKVNQQ